MISSVLAVVLVASAFGYPWRGPVPVTVTIRDHTPAEWRPIIEQAAADWSLSPVLDVVVLPSDGVCSIKSKADICAGSYGLGNAHPAWTAYASHRGYMTDVRTYLNLSYLDGYSPEQKAHIVCHEMSHMLGILAEGGCSEDTSWREHPTQADYDRLLDIYN